MSIKEELHDLVERLSDEEAANILALLREQTPNGNDPIAPVLLSQCECPPVVSGHAFFNMPSKTLADIIAEQGTRPIKNIDELRGDFWPEDEGPDEFVNALREWRREGN